MENARRELAIGQITSARNYTLTLLDDLSPEDWFRVPTGSPTHLAWQMGHLAMAEYGLTLFRMRGRQPADLDLMSGAFRKLFSKGSVPQADATAYPSVDEIRATFDRVHQQALAELAAVSNAVLDEPADMPYFAYPTKFGCLLMCSHHEMLHAGQIGLLRRLLGKPPVR